MRTKYLSYILMVIIMGACESTQKYNSSQCESEPMISKEVELRIGNAELQEILPLWNDNQVDLSYTVLDTKEFNEICTFLAKEVNQNGDIYSIILYLDYSIIKNDIMLTDVNFIGLSFYYFELGKMHHSFYKKENGIYFLDNDISTEANRISFKDILGITKSKFNYATQECFSYVALFPKPEKSYDPSKSHHKLREKIFGCSMLKEQVHTTNECPLPCPIDPDNDDCCWNGLTFECDHTYADPEDDPECAETNVDNMLQVENYTYDTTLTDTSLHYFFRDSILSYMANGDTLIKQYYALSSYFSDRIDLDLAIETISVLDDINTIINLISNDNDQISAIDDSLAQEFYDVIDAYIAVSDEQSVINLLNAYKDIINNNIGATGSQISFVIP